MRRCPASSSAHGRNWRTSLGTPPSQQWRASSAAVSTVSGAGFKMTALPAANAARILRREWRKGNSTAGRQRLLLPIRLEGPRASARSSPRLPVPVSNRTACSANSGEIHRFGDLWVSLADGLAGVVGIIAAIVPGAVVLIICAAARRQSLRASDPRWRQPTAARSEASTAASMVGTEAST